MKEFVIELKPYSDTKLTKVNAIFFNDLTLSLSPKEKYFYWLLKFFWDTRVNNYSLRGQLIHEVKLIFRCWETFSGRCCGSVWISSSLNFISPISSKAFNKFLRNSCNSGLFKTISKVFDEEIFPIHLGRWSIYPNHRCLVQDALTSVKVVVDFGFGLLISLV